MSVSLVTRVGGWWRRGKQRLKNGLYRYPLPFLFDAAFYADQQRLTGLAARWPWLHFLCKGHRRGASPHPLFDAVYYRTCYPEVDWTRHSPVVHYLTVGWRQGARPHPLFDGAWYRVCYTDVAEAGTNPLMHFCLSGEAEGRQPHPLWDVEFVRRRHPGVRLRDYMADPACWTIDTHPLFDAAFYREQLVRAGEPLDSAPLLHFVAGGWRRGFYPHPLFDGNWYRQQYEDVREADVNPLVHYVTAGEREHRQPHPFFEPLWYRHHLEREGVPVPRHLPAHYLSPEGLRAFPHPVWDPACLARQLGTDEPPDLVRYLRDPSLWSLDPHPLFDGAYYRRHAEAVDPVPDHQAPVMHFLVRGWRKRIDPHPLFDVDWYLRRFKPLARSGRNPLAHYIEFAGRSRRCPHVLWHQPHVNAQLKALQPPLVLQEYLKNPDWWHISPHPLFDVAYYREQAAAAGLRVTQSPLEHYRRVGWRHGLSPQPLFDPVWYDRRYRDVETATPDDPLTHFLIEGEYSGCNPHPCVDIDRYRKQLFDNGWEDDGQYLLHYLSGAPPRVSIHPLWDQAWVDRQCAGHSVRLPEYLQNPDCWHLSPHPLFDPAEYRRQAAARGLRIGSQAPLAHFLRESRAARVPTHVLFDPAWYRRYYRDVGERGYVPLVHYIARGQYEGRNPHPLWDQAHVDSQCPATQPVRPVDYLRDPARRTLDPHPLWDTAWLARRHTRPVAFLDYLADPACRFLNTHPLFDAAYYRHQAETAGLTIRGPALRHFLEIGWREGLNPHRLFDVCWYRSTYRDVVDFDCNPLLHYLAPGETYQRDPHPLFDSERYRRALAQQGVAPPDNLLVHFLEQGDDAPSPHPLWDTAYLKAQNGGQSVSLLAYLADHALWGLHPHPLFDVAWYQGQVGRTDTAPLLHYVSRPEQTANPGAYFHTEWYVGRHRYLTDFRGQSRVPLVHFLEKGDRQGESPHPYFDARWYAEQYLGADRRSESPILHYWREGWRTGCNPNPLFDAAAYRQRHPIPGDEDPLKWFLQRQPVRLPIVRNRFTDVFACQPVPARPAGGVTDRTPPRRYLVLFTPRSGSSLLTDLLASTGLLGQPGEWLNPDLVQRARNTLPGGADTPAVFTRKIQWYRQGDNGVFGAQVAWPHLVNVMDADCEALLVDANEPIVLHCRQNVVAQAVSLYLAAESGYFHSHQVQNRRYLPGYDAAAIAGCIDRLLEQEAGLARYLEHHPKRRLCVTTYEALAADARGVIDRVGDFLGVDCRGVAMHSPRRKVRTALNAEYEARFRDEANDFLMRRLARRRALYAGWLTVPEDLFR